VITRTRSEYRLQQLDGWSSADDCAGSWTARAPSAGDRDGLATVILQAYRGTIDDEGEDDDAALMAVDEWLGRAERPHSVVLEIGGLIVAVSFVVDVAGRMYIDPVATAPRHKRHGLGRAAVCVSLRSLQRSGTAEVGAVITDGNIASEGLFTGLGFVRVGAWD
jgi:L-amino acid N-acyltransferase YncA